MSQVNKIFSDVLTCVSRLLFCPSCTYTADSRYCAHHAVCLPPSWLDCKLHFASSHLHTCQQKSKLNVAQSDLTSHTKNCLHWQRLVSLEEHKAALLPWKPFPLLRRHKTETVVPVVVRARMLPQAAPEAARPFARLSATAISSTVATGTPLDGKSLRVHQSDLMSSSVRAPGAARVLVS